MHLKKIIVSGFKSFADRIAIDFDKGITGIVGPNGSGKSNVIDAVRWVMGEQNAKHLRGQVATDIIFAGSAKRKALGMAEVTLVFDNQDKTGICPPEYRHESEIALTRRLYSDGTREYLINKKSCRLKDIVGFFATTGLGGRSYSMIQQGQVERILNAKPEDIREILEEAAGTLVFKHRRHEAQKKLQNTQENLLRLEDIIKELERQEASLRGQVDKARKYRDHTEELKQWELDLFGHNFRHFSDKLQGFTSEDKEQEDQDVSLTTRTSTLEARQVELQHQLDAADPDLQGLAEQVTIIREELARAESTISNATQLLENGEVRLEEMDKEISSDTQHLEEIEKQFESASQDLDTAKKHAKELEELIDSFQDEVDAVDETAQVYQGRIEDCDDQVKNIDRMLDTNSVRCEAIGRDRQRITEELDDLEKRLEAINSEHSDLDERSNKLKEKIAEKKAGLDEVLARKQSLEQNIQQREQESDAQAKERDSLKENYLNQRARLTSLQELEASASDVGSELEKLRNAAPELGSRIGLLTDFISFNSMASELSPRAASAFERWAERIVVEDLNDFNDLVKTAHQLDLASLPVIILSQLPPLNSQDIERWANEYEAEAFAAYLTVSKKLNGLDQLVNQLYHLPLLNIDASDVTSLPGSVVLFTAQGVTLRRHSEFVIGAKSGKGILARRTEQEKLATSLKLLEKDLASAQAKFDQLITAQRQDRCELNELAADLQSQNQDVMDEVAELQGLQQQQQYRNELLAGVRKQIDQLKEKDQQAIKELEELGERRLALAEDREGTLRELEQIREEATMIEEQREEVFRQHQSRKVDLAKSEAKAQAIESSFAQTKQQLERIQATLSRRYEERSRLEAQFEQAKSSKTRCETEIHQLLARRENLEAELTDKRQENAGILEELRSVDKQLKEIRDQHNKVQNRRNQLQLEMEKLRIALAGIQQQASERYHIELSSYELDYRDDFDAERASKQVSKLRSKIESLGAINMMAIEEYDELNRRQEFILSQREEVTSSITLLEEAIEEIEETSKSKFLTTFTIINAEFGNLFPILFPGGDARLELTDPTDPLNGGVEILCRLPGKKQQRMNLFSGGEKALTAISLIFALLKTKPTPFCFLDEVDAPLDEANVGRYNRVLEALSERFQFIVITHNRRTMEVLDTLYGVTMQEPGVSKVVGVDLRKDLPEHLRKAFKAAPKKDEAQSGSEGERSVEGASSL